MSAYITCAEEPANSPLTRLLRGKDEIHLYDLEQHREFRLSRSRYGSVAPSDPTPDDTLLFTTYSLEGYRLARQPIVADSLVPVAYRKIPENRVNPPRRKWNIINIDTVRGDSLFRDGVRVKRYRKETHLFNLHSWAPWNFNPFNIAGESRIDVGFGATVMSQNLLANTFGYLAYGYSPGNGSLLRGALNYYGWAPNSNSLFSMAVESSRSTVHFQRIEAILPGKSISIWESWPICR